MLSTIQRCRLSSQGKYLVEGHDVHGVGVAAVAGGLGRHPEPEWKILHTVDDDALVLWCVLSDTTQPRLHHVVDVQELLLRPRLHPDLVLGIGRQEIERGDVQPELAGFGEFTETRSK